ncbi:uncharacterized protein BO88DRAFT_150923 [Aspergillus vadensis CBS 113365]|uniref:Uncharacterized protein n=1 Tax=Aspergillus vadensis (strain CBS 113365 / IMI 142717 / IBT 24658) TaxID=1448311 RepID=A0A319AXN8_ASPVC|nr:hypothetical protein BO88DRAFT_150923 [Aspergillus vadensis CBS 113365]PYH65077.1 hypothetical protein BO88DRAFT_150923 [Aspergillus vadensis CBS 113365]
MPTITPQPHIQSQSQSQSQSHPRSPFTTSDENNSVTWEHLEHAPPSLSSLSADTTARNNDGRSTAENYSGRVPGLEMRARSEAVHVEDVMGMGDGTGATTGMGMGPGPGRAPAIRIYPPGDTVSTSASVSMVGGDGGEQRGGGSTKSASFFGRYEGLGR